MWERPTNRRMALQALLALGGGLCSPILFADPNTAARAPGSPEELLQSPDIRIVDFLAAESQAEFDPSRLSDDPAARPMAGGGAS